METMDLIFRCVMLGGLCLMGGTVMLGISVCIYKCILDLLRD